MTAAVIKCFKYGAVDMHAPLLSPEATATAQAGSYGSISMAGSHGGDVDGVWYPCCRVLGTWDLLWHVADMATYQGKGASHFQGQHQWKKLQRIWGQLQGVAKKG